MREDRAELPGLWFSCKKCPPCPRELSPQRKLNYRDNWYLAAHCHVRNGLRVFSLDRMSGVQTLAQPALDTHTAEWAQVSHAGYGIYNGGAAQTAVPLFDAASSRWVRAPTWHTNPVLRPRPGGSLERHLPHLNPQELVIEILSCGSAVKVLSPSELSTQVIRALKANLAQY